MKNYSGFGDFLGSYFEDTIGAFGIVIIAVIFFAVVLKVFDGIGFIGAKATGLDPNSGKGEERRTRIGFVLFGAFIFFALFIAPNIGD